jgi:hypothetical protein
LSPFAAGLRLSILQTMSADNRDEPDAEAPRPSSTAKIFIGTGICMLVLALVGWLATMVVTSMASRPKFSEDLTTVWTTSGSTKLGGSTTVEVPVGQTLVAFLVGTQLRGTAGTTTGTCSAASAGGSLPLGWPVQINPSLTGVLATGQEIVAIAGWTNAQDSAVTVQITCASSDSTVDHFVAVPTRTAIVQHDPWFKPVAWIALAALGIAATVAGLAI